MTCDHHFLWGTSKYLPVAQQVVHVHDLRPSLLVADEIFVLEVDDELVAAGKRPSETTAVGRQSSSRRTHFQRDVVNLGGSLREPMGSGRIDGSTEGRRRDGRTKGRWEGKRAKERTDGRSNE